MIPAHFENLRLELRRGTLMLTVLSALRTERYGYALRQVLAEHKVNIDQGTLYPLLRRLEAQGLLLSQWRTQERRKKRFYRLTADGELILELLLAEVRSINASLERVVAASG